MTGVRFYHVFYLISRFLRQDPIQSLVGHNRAEDSRVGLVNRNFGSSVEAASKMTYLITIVAPYGLPSASTRRRRAYYGLSEGRCGPQRLQYFLLSPDSAGRAFSQPVERHPQGFNIS